MARSSPLWLLDKLYDVPPFVLAYAYSLRRLQTNVPSRKSVILALLVNILFWVYASSPEFNLHSFPPPSRRLRMVKPGPSTPSGVLLASTPKGVLESETPVVAPAGVHPGSTPTANQVLIFVMVVHTSHPYILFAIVALWLIYMMNPGRGL